MIISLIQKIPNKVGTQIATTLIKQPIIAEKFSEATIANFMERWLILGSIVVIIGCIGKIFMELEERKNVES